MPVSASVSHDLSPCPPLQLMFEVFLGNPTPIPRSFSGTPTSRQRHRRMRVFFARAASPCFAWQAWHLMCVCVCLSPPRRFQFCVGLFSLSQLVYFFVVSEFVSMDIFNLMVRIYLIATICLSCFCRLLFHSYICLTLTIHTVSYLFYQPKSLLHPRHCRLISACLSRCIYSDFFLADILLSVVSPPTRIFSRLPYIFW